MCEPRRERNCFCNATFSNGVHILHGNMGSFVKEEFFTGQTFLTDAYRAFRQVNWVVKIQHGWKKFLPFIMSSYHFIHAPHGLTGEIDYKLEKEFYCVRKSMSCAYTRNDTRQR